MNQVLIDCFLFLQNGDNAVYWAARQGHVDVIKFLKDQAVTIDMQNNVSLDFSSTI